jgi:pimeloyl-ACP methyl ester carboxylesterase
VPTMSAPASPANPGMPRPVEATVPVADGVALNVLLWPGHGEAPIVLVHGLASTARLWDGVAMRLAAAGHPVASVDLRGHGRSDKPDHGYDFTTVTDDLRAVITALGWDRPVIAGQSYGGNVVIELAYRFPEIVGAVACVDGGTIELGERFPEWEDCEAALAPPELTGVPRTALEERIRSVHADWPEEGIQGALATMEDLPDGTVKPWLSRERHMTILRHLWEHRPSQRYSLVPARVLFLMAETGEAAWTADKRAGIDRALRLLPHGSVEWFNADHDLHAQHPGVVASHLRSLAPGGAA